MSSPLWDGSNLGDRNDLIIASDGATCYFPDKTEAYITSDIGSLQLIADELKPLFGIEKMGRNRCRISGRPLIIHRKDSSDIVLSYPNPYKEDVRKNYVFRWLLGLKENYDRSFLVRGSRIISNVELKYDYLSEGRKGSFISLACIKRWFGTWEVFTQIAKEMVRQYDFTTLRFAIERVIRRIDPDYVLWTSLIMERASHYLS